MTFVTANEEKNKRKKHSISYAYSNLVAYKKKYKKKHFNVEYG